MLKSPARKATATARPVNMRGVAPSSVRPMAVGGAPPPPAGPPGHQQAELLVGRVRADLADDPPVVDDRYAVGERADLFELERDEQDGLALRALLEELAVDELDCA